jgi:tRNA (guanine-N7-)-methyltransferase
MKVRVREHVNPLSHKYQDPTPPPNWQEVYGDRTLPLSLDIGCGKGEYILKMAQLKPDWNWLGLEIREPLVERAIAIKQELGLSNLYYLFCNVNVSLEQLLPANSVQQLTIQFPDPWFKRRQQKRRTVQPELIKDLTKILIPGSQVLLQSDIQMVAREMLKYFEENGRFTNLAGTGNFADDHCYPEHVPTDREEWTIFQNGDIYRAHLKFCP